MKLYPKYNMLSPEVIPDPVALAEEDALRVFYQPDDFERKPEDAEILNRLDFLAGELNFIDQAYFVRSARALAIPVEDFTSDERVSVWDLKGEEFTGFHGTFACYSKVQIGRIIGAQSVRALCLTFHEVTLMPYMDSLPEQHLLYVPVPAVDKIEQTQKFAA
jgi:hypothetical protein